MQEGCTEQAHQAHRQWVVGLAADAGAQLAQQRTQHGSQLQQLAQLWGWKSH